MPPTPTTNTNSAPLTGRAAYIYQRGMSDRWYAAFLDGKMSMFPEPPPVIRVTIDLTNDEDDDNVPPLGAPLLPAPQLAGPNNVIDLTNDDDESEPSTAPSVPSPPTPDDSEVLVTNTVEASPPKPKKRKRHHEMSWLPEPAAVFQAAMGTLEHPVKKMRREQEDAEFEAQMMAELDALDNEEANDDDVPETESTDEEGDEFAATMRAVLADMDDEEEEEEEEEDAPYEEDTEVNVAAEPVTTSSVVEDASASTLEQEEQEEDDDDLF